MIVVGVDGSEGAAAALRFAVEEARLRRTHVVAVHLWAAGQTIAGATSYAFLPYGAYPPREGDVDKLRTGAEEALAKAVEDSVGDPEDVRIERRAVESGTVEGLLDAARDAELLVVGSRGLGGFRGLLLGSVSQQCAAHAPCPVVVVRPPHHA